MVDDAKVKDICDIYDWDGKGVHSKLFSKQQEITHTDNQDG